MVGSHSDDLEVGAGGTAARLVKEGNEVDFLLICNLSRIKNISKRLEEAHIAAEVLGTNLEVIDLQEGNFRDIPKTELVAKLDKTFESKPYKKVFVPCHCDSHSDHSFAARVFFSVCRKNLNDLLMYEPAIPSGITPDPFFLNYFVDISNEIKQKMDAVHCHESQIEQYGEDWIISIESRARYLGQRFNKKFVEAFSVVKIIV
jgi:LmbE family N-acetylglucosaminyl deacetylase